MEKLEPFQADLIKVVRAVSKLHKKSISRLEKQRQILSDCMVWETFHHQAELLQANLYKVKRGLNKIEVEDWLDGKTICLELEPRVEPHLQVAKLFKKARKLKVGIPFAEKQLAKVELNVAATIEMLAHAQVLADEIALQDFCKKHGLQIEEYGKGEVLGSCVPVKSKKIEELPKPYHKFISQEGIEIWVGKSAKNNDTLSFQCANGSDYWLHAHNYPGSHVVIRVDRGKEVSPETLADALELAIRFSKAKEKQEGEVCLTQVKYLRRVKGSPGKVMLSSHKVLHHVLNEERFLSLKNRKNERC